MWWPARRKDLKAARSYFPRSRSAAPTPRSWRRRWRTAPPSSTTPRASRKSPTWPIASTRWARGFPAPAQARIVIEGVAKLNGARHAVLPDRIETGTYAMAVAMAGGDVLLQNTRADLLQAALDVLAQTGAVGDADQPGHPHRTQRRRLGAGGRDHRAVPGLSHRPAGAAHGADDARARHLAHRRDHLREPLHARAANWRGSAPAFRSTASGRRSRASSGSRARR